MSVLTMRRRLLDLHLSASTAMMRGRVIDIGGKKSGKRGFFTPPAEQAHVWHYSNIDRAADPDVCCSADAMSVMTGSYDTALLCEVIEHIVNPERALHEIYRILKPGGRLILTCPLLFPVHADPHDFQRWTDSRIRLVLKDAGFSDIKVAPMGGVGAVIHDIIYVAFVKHQNRCARYVGVIVLFMLAPMLSFIDMRMRSVNKCVTTGYFVKAQKVAS